MKSASHQSAPAGAGPLPPVDVVYTWVDGSDPQWAGRNREMLRRHGIPAPATSERFANHDELRFSLRSVERFMPWVRRIFIVTDRQVPEWLAAGHPRVRVVDHTEIFPDRDCLPTFNSVAIECNLHRIPELAEHYIYFNDDMMVGRPFGPEDFFAPDGRPYSFLFQYGRSRRHRDRLKRMPRWYRYLQLLRLGLWVRWNHNRQHQFSVKLRTNRITIIRRLGRTLPYFKTRHTPIPLTRSLVRAVEAQFRPEFEACRRHHFRAKDDLFFPELYATVGILQGLTRERYFHLSDLFYYHLGLPRSSPSFALLREGAFRFININDDCGDVAPDELWAFRSAMNELFPTPSSFERAKSPRLSLAADTGEDAAPRAVGW